MTAVPNWTGRLPIVGWQLGGLFVLWLIGRGAVMVSLHLPPLLRPVLQSALGPRGFTLAYSALSLAVLVWLIGAAGRAPFVPLWDWALWQVYVPLVAMLPVCLILSLAIARPNPFSFAGAQNAMFDPAALESSACTATRSCWRWCCGPPPTPCRMAIWRI